MIQDVNSALSPVIKLALNFYTVAVVVVVVDVVVVNVSDCSVAVE